MFSVKIKELRLQRELRQEDVYKAINISQSAYTAYEKGTQSPQLKIIENLAKFYGVTIVELLSDNKPELNERLLAKFKLIEKLEDEEKASLMMVIEGILLRNQNLSLSKKFN